MSDTIEVYHDYVIHRVFPVNKDKNIYLRHFLNPYMGQFEYGFDAQWLELCSLMATVHGMEINVVERKERT